MQLQISANSWTRGWGGYAKPATQRKMQRRMLPEPTTLSRLSFGFLSEDTGSNMEVCHYSTYIQNTNRCAKKGKKDQGKSCLNVQGNFIGPRGIRVEGLKRAHKTICTGIPTRNASFSSAVPFSQCALLLRGGSCPSRQTTPALYSQSGVQTTLLAFCLLTQDEPHS